jgi:Transmembrane secretion effector
VVGREDLVAANAISGLTWSVMLAGGAALGGLVVDALGPDAAFLLDAASFLLSAAFTASVATREAHLEGRARTHPLQDLREGLGYLAAHRDVAMYALSKTLWAVGGGGVLVLLPLFGREVFPAGEGGALSMGVLYAARGVGAGLGPVLAHRLGGASTCGLRRWLGPAFLLMGLGYLLLGGAPSLPLAAGALVVAHCGGSIQWVFSTALLQREVPGRLLGRVFAAELTVLTLVTCASSYAVGQAADAGWPPRALAQAVALALTGLLWRAPRPAGGARAALEGPGESATELGGR